MTISRLFSTILDFVLPRYCPVCGSKLKPDEPVLCVSCLIMLPRVDFSTADKQEVIADDTDADNGWDSLSIKKKPRIRTLEDNEITDRFLGKARVERAAALFWYHGHGDFARLIYDIKYKGGYENARAAGALLAEELQPQGFFEGIDVILPVPLSFGRLTERGYNQSLMIAKGIKKVTGIPVTNNVLLRKSFDGSQTQLTATERAENVKEAFVLINPAPVANRHVLLVDDVVTTGATAGECARLLSQVPGCRVSVVSLGVTAR